MPSDFDSVEISTKDRMARNAAVAVPPWSVLVTVSVPPFMIPITSYGVMTRINACYAARICRSMAQDDVLTVVLIERPGVKR